MQSGAIRNNKITTSSDFNRYHASWLGRLQRARHGAYKGAWSARHNNHNQWFKVDFGRPTKITKIATQGRQDVAQWVTRFLVTYSLDGAHWATYRFKSADVVKTCVSDLC